MTQPGDFTESDSLAGLRPARLPSAPEDYVNVMADDQPRAAHSDNKGEDAGLLDYWRILTRRKRAWATFAMLGALLGFLFAFPRTPEYQASTLVEIVGLNQDFLNMKGTSPITTGGASASDNVSEIQTQIKLLESDSLAHRVIAQLKQHPPPISTMRTRFSPCRILQLDQSARRRR